MQEYNSTIGEIRQLANGNPPPPPPHKSMEGARAMADRGFRVFPLKANSKEPAINKWQILATTDVDQIEKWERQFPAANYGVVGDSAIIVDVDCKDGKPGFENAAKLALPPTYTIETPTGGQHWYYKADAPVSPGAGVFGNGVDIRSGNSYVVGPGSVIDGRAYKPISKPGIKIAEAPPILTALRKPAESTAPVAPPIVTNDLDGAIQRAKEWLLTREPAIEGKGGDEWTYKTATRVLEIVPDVNAAVAAMVDWNARCNPPWADGCRDKIENAWAYMKGQRGKLTAEGLFDAVPEPKPANTTPLFYSMADVTTPETRHDPYIVKGILWQATDAQIFGEMHVGKTFLILDMAIHIAAGRDWMGHRVRPSRVMYLPYEGKLGIHDLRLPAIRAQYPDIAWDTLPFGVVNMNFPLVSEANVDQNSLPGRVRLQEAIKAFAAQYGGPPELIIIDTYSRAIGGDASSESLAQKFAAMVGALIDTYGSTVLRIHHPGQKNKDRARGSYSIGAGIDTNLHVEAGKLTLDKQRDSAKSALGFDLKVVNVYRDQDGDQKTSCVVIPAPVPVDLSLTDNQSTVLQIIEQTMDRNRHVQRKVVRDKARELEINRKRFSDTLEQLKTLRRIDYDLEQIELLEMFSDDDDTMAAE